MQSLLTGAYDLHIHCWPDVVERKVDDFTMAERALACGMKGFAIKSHYTPTAERATVVRKMYPHCNAIGSIVLNSTIGGINPMAVECAARNQAKIVWFPTMDSSHDQKYMLDNLPQYVDMQFQLKKKGIPVNPVGIFDSDGKLLPSVFDVLDLIYDHNMVVASGHMSHSETFAMVQEAHRKHIQKIIITHADWESTYYSIDDQLKLVALGATIEHSFTSPWQNHISWQEVFEQIRAVGPEHCILSTDLGQKQNIYPDEGLTQFVKKLLEDGFPEKAVRTMIVDNPASLVE